MKRREGSDLHWRKLERLYTSARCNEYYRPRIAIGEGTCEIRIAVREDFFHAADAVHGSVYFKALDDAAFFAANSGIEDVLVLTASYQISFFRPIDAGELIARGTVVHPGRQLVFAEAVLEDEAGRTLARGSGSFAKSRIPLRPEIGYV